MKFVKHRTMDSLGRVVIPQEFREERGCTPVMSYSFLVTAAPGHDVSKSGQPPAFCVEPLKI